MTGVRWQAPGAWAAEARGGPSPKPPSPRAQPLWQWAGPPWGPGLARGGAEPCLSGRGLTSREDACLPSDSGEQTRARTFPSVRPATKPNLPPLPFSDARRRPQPLGLGLTAPAGTDGSAPA